ncbi:hypothetical protein [Snuella sedimenti]|uniref:Uncharacterized protein n=1 Tax=Snuella sedimenti TaxID=2798802 RepID=A0A8J7LSM1_9FLAO|nr:hypothetical protein [Snuella sedimenti]MBJ6368580.1 hypothetical protein [Snuella sedimenti]
MKQALTLLIFLAFHFQIISQEYIPADNFKFKLIKAKKAVGGNYYYTIKTTKDVEKVQVRFKMKSISGDHADFDPNKFYLVTDQYKKRVKPIDVRHNYAAGWIFIGFEHLVNFQPTDKKLKEWLSYKPHIKNTFNDYKIEGYEDICHNINFGTKKKPRVASPYLGHKDLKSCKIDLYFSLPKDLKVFKIYYGKEIIADTRIK